jgi:hypothetical protein
MSSKWQEGHQYQLLTWCRGVDWEHNRDVCHYNISVRNYCRGIQVSLGDFSCLQVALALCARMDTTECLFTRCRSYSAFRQRLVLIDFLYTVWPKKPFAFLRISAPRKRRWPFDSVFRGNGIPQTHSKRQRKVTGRSFVLLIHMGGKISLEIIL